MDRKIPVLLLALLDQNWSDRSPGIFLIVFHLVVVVVVVVVVLLLLVLVLV